MSPSATHPVIAGLSSADPGERSAACAAAVSDPSAVLLLDALAEALGDADRSVRRAASNALASLSAQVDVDGCLKAAMRGPTPEGRFAAVHTRARFSPPDPSLLPIVVEALSAREGDVRWAAARMLVDMGRMHPEILQIVLGLVDAADNPVLRRMAVFCLRELAPDDRRAAASLEATTHSDDLELRRAGFSAMAALIDPPRRVLDRLSEAIASEADLPCRRIAALALGGIAQKRSDPLPSFALAALKTAAATGDEALRQAATGVLAGIPEKPNKSY